MLLKDITGDEINIDLNHLQAAGVPVGLELGGEGATSWDIGNIQPGDTGNKTVTLHNAGYRDGFVIIWISDIVSSEGTNPESETGDTAEPGELSDYLLLNLSCSKLSTNLSLPVTIDNFPQSASALNYITISPLNAGETLTLNWEWELPLQTGNEVQGDSLSFTVNFVLEELPHGVSGGDDGDEGRDGGGDGVSPPEPKTLLLKVDMWGKIYTGEMTEEGVLIETIEAVSPKTELTLSLPKGTKVLDQEGNPLYLIVVRPVTPPQPPQDKFVIGSGYDFQPSCIFDPPIKLILHYGPQALADGINEKDLVTAYYCQGAGKWVILPSVVDSETQTVTTSLSHSSVLGILAPAPEVTRASPAEQNPSPTQDVTLPSTPNEPSTPTSKTAILIWIAIGVLLLCCLLLWTVIRRRLSKGHLKRYLSIAGIS